MSLSEVSYERLLSIQTAAGFSFAYSLNDEDIDLNHYALPYFRIYFGKKWAADFYLEGNFLLYEERFRRFNSSK